MEMRDLERLIARQSMGTTLEDAEHSGKRRNKGDALLISTVLRHTIESDDGDPGFALVNAAATLIRGGLGRLWHGFLWDGEGVVLLLLVEGEGHHTPCEVLHALGIGERCLCARIETPYLRCEGIVLCELLWIRVGDSEGTEIWGARDSWGGEGGVLLRGEEVVGEDVGEEGGACVGRR